MKKAVPVIGFVILALMALLVFGAAAYNAFTTQPIIGVLLALGLVGLLFTLFNESKALSTLTAENLLGQKNLLFFAAVVLGAILSYYIDVNLKLGAVLGAALTGLLAFLFFPDYAVPAYTGAFVGMASIKLLPSFPALLIAGVVAGIVYILALTVYGGFGGKLGTIAAAGCAFTGLCLSTEFTHPGVPAWNVGRLLVATSIVAAVVTYYLNNNRKHGAVLASAVVGLVGGVLLPAVFGDVGKTLAVMAICASFAGMSNTKRMPNMLQVALVGLFAALVYMFSSPFIGGTGGKLGTIALGSGLAIRGLFDLVAKFQAPKKSESSAAH
jgi:hypothetical protein